MKTSRFSGLVAMLLIGMFVRSPGASQAPSVKDTTAGVSASHQLVGTWALVSRELLDESGNVASRVRNPRGLLVHDRMGHAAEIVTRGGRAAYGQGGPTPQEALDTFNSYTGFFGTYRQDSPRSEVTYQVAGDVNPSRTGRQDARTYELTSTRLVMISTQTGPAGAARKRSTWERIPELESLSPVQQGLVGFWRWIR
jgi:hypothetical protein